MNGSKQLLRLTATDRVLVLAVHPDDESLATGGLLRRAVSVGAAVRVVFVTDGEDNPWPQRVVEGRWRIGPADRARWGRRRRHEALAALARLGVAPKDARFLGWPDQGLTRLLLGDAAQGAVETLAGQLRDWRPTLLLAPSLRDRHPDHNALAVLLRLALEPARNGGGPGEALRTLHYVVHGEAPAVGSGVRLPLFVWEKHAKRAAIGEHRSQLRLSRQRFLAYATDEERYEVVDGREPVVHVHGTFPSRWTPPHPLEWPLPKPLRLGERPRLLLVLPPAAGGQIRVAQTRSLPGTAGGAVTFRLPSGVPVGEAEVRVERRRISARFPASLLPPGGRGFVKLQRDGGFLDAAGWQEFRSPRAGREEETFPSFPRLAHR